MILIFSIALIASICVLLLNTKFLTNVNSRSFAVKERFFDQAQDWYLNFIPDALKLFVDKNLFYTKLKKKSIYQDLFYSLLVSILLLVIYFYTGQTYLLFFVIFAPAGVFLDFVFKVQDGKKSFIDSLDHLVSCLEILTVKTETPLSNSLKIVSDSLPDDLYVAKNELNSILLKAEKLGMEQVLNSIDRDSVEEQEFISILQSIQKGTNKSALKKNLQDFLIRQKVVQEEKRKMFVENMQLYLMLPGTVMLIIAMYPLIDMILFQLKGAF